MDRSLRQLSAGVDYRGASPALYRQQRALSQPGHAHLYERYTRTMKADGRQIPYIAAGNGGYYGLPGLKTKSDGSKPTAGQHSEPDGQGNTISLDQYNDTEYGFLRITVSKATIQLEALTVSLAPPIPPATSPAVTMIDSFTLNLAAHKVTTP